MLLSIIIPVYNVEKYIKKTLDSIFEQSFSQDELEVVLVNDGTPDNSMQIVTEFEKKHSNLHVINQQNKGLSGARNTGLEIARGQYIWFVDSDDWLEQGCITKILKRLSSATEDVFVFKINEYNEAGEIIYNRKFRKNAEYTLTGIDALLDKEFDHVPMQIYIVRKALYETHHLRFVEGIQDEDVEFSARMLLVSNTVVFSTITSYCYLRRSSGNITAGKYLSQKRIKSYFYILNVFSKIENDSNKPKVKRAFIELQRNYILMLYYRVSPDDLRKEGFLQQPFLGYSKRVVKQCMKYRKNTKSIVKDLIFLVSVNLYNKYMTQQYIR